MKTNKKQKMRRRISIVIVLIIIIAMVFTYVVSLRGFALGAPETPAPPGSGTDWDYDESYLPEPWQEEPEEVKPQLILQILSGGVRMDVGDQQAIQYRAENFPEGAVLTWSSSNPNVAAVDTAGYVKAYMPGKTEITVSGEGLKSSVLVIVNELKAKRITIKVNGEIITLGPKSYKVIVGDVVRLNAVIEPEGAKVEKIVWGLGNNNVASLIPNSQVCDFVAEAVGETQVTVTADGLVDAISFSIEEGGVPVDTLWEYIKYGVIVVVVAIALVVLLTWLSQKKKKEKARQKALAKRRKLEAEKRALEEAEQRAREEAERRRVEAERQAIEENAKQETPGQMPAQTEARGTLKIDGSAVGASVSAPRYGIEELPDRPVTLDDLD